MKILILDSWLRILPIVQETKMRKDQTWSRGHSQNIPG